MSFAECIDCDSDDEKVPQVNPPIYSPKGGHSKMVAFLASLSPPLEVIGDIFARGDVV